MERLRAALIPMAGRMLHDEQGRLQLVPYGNKPHEVIYSVSRGRPERAAHGRGGGDRPRHDPVRGGLRRRGLPGPKGPDPDPAKPRRRGTSRTKS